MEKADGRTGGQALIAPRYRYKGRRKRRNTSAEEQRRIRSLYEEGWSLREVGVHLEMTKGGVRHVLDRLGVKRRSQGTGKNLMRTVWEVRQ